MNNKLVEKPLWCAPGAQIYGDVRFHENVNIWPNATLRAESDYIEIGAFTNIQDFAMVHIADRPTIIGEYCSITHHCTIHGATIGDNCLIGINATVMDGAVVGANSIVAGHTIVTEGTIIPENSIVAGVPGKVVATRNSYVDNKLNAVAYYENALGYLEGNHRVWADDAYAEKMMALKEALEQELTG